MGETTLTFRVDERVGVAVDGDRAEPTRQNLALVSEAGFFFLVHRGRFPIR